MLTDTTDLLASIRESVKRWRTGEDSQTVFADEVAARIVQLDTALLAGGAPPKQWVHALDMPMDVVQRALVDEAIDRVDGLSRDDVIPDYGGRARVSPRCWGIALRGQGQLYEFLAALSIVAGKYARFCVAFEDSMLHMVGVTCTDGMSFGIVAYWPGYQLISDEDTPATRHGDGWLQIVADFHAIRDARPPGWEPSVGDAVRAIVYSRDVRRRTPVPAGTEGVVVACGTDGYAAIRLANGSEATVATIVLAPRAVDAPPATPDDENTTT